MSGVQNGEWSESGQLELILDTVKYVPDWSTECCNCGQYPVVDYYEKRKLVGSSDMCGPCTFGEAATIDPDIW